MKKKNILFYKKLKKNYFYPISIDFSDMTPMNYNVDLEILLQEGGVKISIGSVIHYDKQTPPSPKSEHPLKFFFGHASEHIRLRKKKLVNTFWTWRN